MYGWWGSRWGQQRSRLFKWLSLKTFCNDGNVPYLYCDYWALEMQLVQLGNQVLFLFNFNALNNARSYWTSEMWLLWLNFQYLFSFLIWPLYWTTEVLTAEVWHGVDPFSHMPSVCLHCTFFQMSSPVHKGRLWKLAWFVTLMAVKPGVFSFSLLFSCLPHSQVILRLWSGLPAMWMDICINVHIYVHT